MRSEPSRRVDRHAAVSQLDVKRRRSIPTGVDLAQRLAGNYARAFAHVKPRHTDQYGMISSASIDDQERAELRNGAA